MRRCALCGLAALAMVGCSGGSGTDLPGADVPGVPGDVVPDVPDSPSSGVVIAPDSIVFAPVTYGCISLSNDICVVNTGEAPVDWTGLSTAACATPEFHVKGTFPIQVPPGAKACVPVAFVPQEVGNKTCDAVVTVGLPAEPAGTVHLSGEALPGDVVTDTFTQVSGQALDLLFVVDDSSAMCPQGSALRNAIASVVADSNLAAVDFHVGVVSTDTDPAVLGRLNRGDSRITPQWLVKGRDDLSLLKSLANLGCDGAAVGTESGLAAAAAAVSLPLVVNTGAPCATDSDCRNNMVVCPNPASCELFCRFGTCGGWNAGFLRDDAQLLIIVVSARPDHDPRPVSDFVTAFQSIKGAYNVDMMHVNAVIQPAGGCTDGADTPISANDRYRQVVEQTNGLLASMCPADWTIPMSIGVADFALKVQFFLSRLADPATVKVSVEGQDCTDHWKYDAPSNSVIPDPTSSCMPQPGQSVVVTYNTLCLTH